MLEVSVHDSVDQGMPFFRAITDQLPSCSSPLVTKTYTMYCSLLNLVYRHFLEPDWSADEVSLLAKTVGNL